MAKQHSPLVGYNTNVRHKGQLYHIQTEDSGQQRPHVMTHLFADGGRVIASIKGDYREHLGSANIEPIVRQLMRQQHKAMFVALRDGVYDDPEKTTEDGTIGSVSIGTLPPVAREEVPAPRCQSPAPMTRPPLAGSTTPLPLPLPLQRGFAEALISDKSLDELILSYLAEDLVSR